MKMSYIFWFPEGWLSILKMFLMIILSAHCISMRSVCVDGVIWATGETKRNEEGIKIRQGGRMGISRFSKRGSLRMLHMNAKRWVQNIEHLRMVSVSNYFPISLVQLNGPID